MDMLDGPGRPIGPRAPLVGRDAELDLLENTFNRSLRDRRAHLFTIYGEAGVGKSRLTREFLDGVERASVLIGRALPYGEGVTYWPLGEMVKAAAGISDDDPLEEAFEKLRECCAEEAVADVLGLAAGLMEALEGERSPQEIAWAAREVMQGIADVQPLILLFEDIHWAEPPLLDLIEHLADWVRAPVLILCLARPELLDARPGWGGGRVRSTAIELEPLSEEESAELVQQLLDQLAGASGERPGALPRDALERAEGNPLFVEETIRMFLESGTSDGADRVPDTLQALIAARIDHLAPDAKTLLQRASVVGRVFWKGALEHLSPDVSDQESLIDDLLQREFLLREPRSSISGETAYRFKHALIREVAYTGLAKLARAQFHARFAEWLAERTGEELVEIRAYHLDQSVEFLTELEGAPPEDLAQETAAALVKAAKRAIAREAYANARSLGIRALELRPTLSARYVAARASWRLQDFATIQVEMPKVREQARELGDTHAEALALTALGEAALKRDADPPRAQELVDEALALLGPQDDPAARFDALTVRATIGAWHGDMNEVVLFMERAYALAMDAGRKDLQTIAAQVLAQTHIVSLELDEAELLLMRALELAGESGSVRARFGATLSYGWFLMVKGELAAAETVFEEVRQTATELGVEPGVAAALSRLGEAAWHRRDYRRAEKFYREALKITSTRGDRGVLPDLTASLAEALALLGKADEAERLAYELEGMTRPDDVHFGVTVTNTWAAVRAAQGHDDEAEELYRTALAGVTSGYAILELAILERLVRFYRERARDDDAVACEARISELLPAEPSRTERIA
jgi:tetratricopeptide (TPR) repeat protein